MAIDKTGISTGEEIRRIVDALESSLIVNFRNFFDVKKDVAITEVDLERWQTEQFKKYLTFQKTNRAIIASYVKPIENAIMSDMKDSYTFGIELVTKHLEQAQKKGATFRKIAAVAPFEENRRVQLQADVIKRRMNEMLNNAYYDLNMRYLATVHQVPNMPAPTLKTAIDMANVDFLNAGVSAGRTAHGHNLNIVNKFETDTQEWSQEMLFIGEGEKASEVGNYYVWITVHSSTCPKCSPWQNKVLIDDVYQDGKPDGVHELLSTAIREGLFHYNCRHNKIPFIPGIDKIPDKPNYVPRTTAEQHALYEKEQKQRYMERQIRMWKRRELGAVSEQERLKAHLKVRQWQARRTELIEGTKGLYRPQYWREKPNFRLARDARWQDLKYNRNLL